MSVELLEQFKLWIERERPRLAESGFTVEISESPVGRTKSSLAVYLQMNDRGGLLTIWNTGESQMSTVNYAADSEPAEEYRLLGSVDALNQSLDLLLAWVRGER